MSGGMLLGGSIADVYRRLLLVILGFVIIIGIAIGAAVCGLALFFLTHPG